MNVRDLPLQGKTALVTGSSRNLGASIASHLASQGARVVLTFHDSPDEARAVIDQLGDQADRGHIAIACDLTSSAGVRDMVAEALEKLDAPIDILVNNVGLWAGDPLVELSDTDWDMVLNTNVKAAFVTSQLLGSRMRESGWGRIVNISGGSAYVRNHSVYGLAKAAVGFLTEELAVELAPEVTVNAVAPGQIAESAEEAEAVMPGFVEAAIAQTPARRLVTRVEVARLVGALCTDRFPLVTGVTIPIDGGWRFHRP
ncbi:MAG: SDR family oxidoreductase [Acidimicrobiia bacterium]|nr:MAG: SDR family oxidoreductase [Acidimicrobiia bacterium]